MVCVPAPAAAGSKLPELTPVPLYVPPEGDAPFNANAEAEEQMSVAEGHDTEGTVVLVLTVTEEVTEQPFKSVARTV